MRVSKSKNRLFSVLCLVAALSGASAYSMDPKCPALLGANASSGRPALEKVRFDAIMAELAYRRALRRGESGASALLDRAKEARFQFAARVLEHDVNLKLARTPQVVDAIWSSHTAKSMIEKARAVREASELSEVDRKVLRPLFEREVLGVASDGDLLLRAVYDEPDEDTPRLVFADWCDENGHPERAEFIRSAIDRVRGTHSLRRERELRSRGDTLLRKHRKEWFGELAAWPGVGFARGFPESILIDDQYHLLSDLEVVLQHPTVTELHIMQGWNQAVFEARKGGTEVLGRLKTLVLYRANQIGDEGVRALCAEKSSLKKLASLAIPENEITAEGVRYLTGEHSVLKSLTSLSLSNNEIGNAGALALSNSGSALKSLTKLDLAACGIGAEGARYLAAETSVLKILTELKLAPNRIGNDGVGYLAAANTALKLLTTLDVSDTDMDREGVRRLARESSGLKTLATLDLSGTIIGEGAKYMAARKSVLKTLTKLSLNGCEIREYEMERLAGPHSALKNLRILNLAYNGFDAETVSLLTDEESALAKLTLLDLSRNPIGSEGAQYLSRPESALTNLEWLNLSGCEIDDEGARHLADRESALRKLHDLYLGGNRLSARGREQLSSRTSPVRNAWSE